MDGHLKKIDSQLKVLSKDLKKTRLAFDAVTKLVSLNDGDAGNTSAAAAWQALEATIQRAELAFQELASSVFSQQLIAHPE